MNAVVTHYLVSWVQRLNKKKISRHNKILVWVISMGSNKIFNSVLELIIEIILCLDIGIGYTTYWYY